MRLILSLEILLRSADALPEIGEDMYRIGPVVAGNTETKVAATLSQIKANLRKQLSSRETAYYNYMWHELAYER